MSKQSNYRLGELVTLKRGYDLPHAARTPGDFPIISSSGVTGTHKEPMVDGPGVVTGRYGTLGDVFYIPGAYWPLNTSLYVQNFKGNEPRFVAYYLRTVLSANFNSAGAVPGVNRNVLHKLAVPAPPKDKQAQRKIAAILTAYDDLIETNKRRITLLEKMAEELYREWFVRMRFPGHQNTKFVKGVPEGWEVKRISEVYQTSSGGTPSRKTPEYFDGNIQWLKTGELKDIFTPESEEEISQSALENSAAKVFPANTVIMAMYCAMPYISIATYDCATNQACCVFLPKSEWMHFGFNYFLLRCAQKQLVMFAHGAAQQNLSQEIIRKFPVLLPSKPLIESFGDIVEPALLMIQKIAESNRLLIRTRDLLLPRLISGKLSVEDFNIHFPPSMREEATEPEPAHA